MGGLGGKLRELTGRRHTAPPAACRARTLIALLLLVLVVSLLGSSGTGSLERSTVTMLINLVVVVGLYSFIGTTGVFSFGHMAFMALGAYTAAILLISPETKELVFSSMAGFAQSASLTGIPALVAGGLVAALLAALLSAPLMRLNGLNASLGTFAVLIIVNVVGLGLDEITNGAQGMSGIPPIGFGTVLGLALAAIALTWLFQQLPVHLKLIGSREDEFAARSIGIRIALARTAAFIFSAFLVGVAGGMFAQAQGAIHPDAFYLQATFITIAMLVVGGMNSLTGAVVGTVVLSVFSELLTEAESGLSLGFVTIDGPTGMREVGFAMVMILILILRPNGMTGGRELTWPLRPGHPARRGSAPVPPVAPSEETEGERVSSEP